MNTSTFIRKAGVLLQYASFCFRLRHPELWGLIGNWFDAPGVKSNVIGIAPKDIAMKRAARRAKTGQGSEFVFVILKEEHAEYKGLKLRNLYNIKTLAAAVMNINETQSTTSHVPAVAQ